MADPSQINQLVAHLFRRESGRLIAVLTHIFGSENIDLAEDVVQDALSEAISHWVYNGIPQNPVAWIYRVAKNKALNILNREKYKKQYASAMAAGAHIEEPDWDMYFSEQEIIDDQVRMMFICCHPALSPDSQIAFTLKTLCGFSIPEIARAFLSNEESIHKRLVRARQKIREVGIRFELPGPDELQSRSEAVLETIYLLFNEGYSASAGNDLIRFELCEEAIRLAEIMAWHGVIEEKSNIYALLALMLFNASRFDARQDESQNILPMSSQDRSKWDKVLMKRGSVYFEKASSGNRVSSYHILAAISAHHCISVDYGSTNWKSILSLYDKLLRIDPSPVVIFNRTIALSKVEGPHAALQELERVQEDPFLSSYYLFHATRAELFSELNLLEESIKGLQKAIQLAPMQAEKKLLQKKLDDCLEKTLKFDGK